MSNREYVRRRLPSAGRGRQIFSHRRPHRGRPILVAGTVIVCLALVFTIGFKVGRKFQTESVAAADRLAVTSTSAGAIAQTRQ